MDIPGVRQSRSIKNCEIRKKKTVIEKSIQLSNKKQYIDNNEKLSIL